MLAEYKYNILLEGTDFLVLLKNPIWYRESQSKWGN